MVPYFKRTPWFISLGFLGCQGNCLGNYVSDEIVDPSSVSLLKKDKSEINIDKYTNYKMLQGLGICEPAGTFLFVF